MKIQPLDIRCPSCGAMPKHLCIRNADDYYSHHQRRVKAAIFISKRKPRPWADGDIASMTAWSKWSGHAVVTLKALRNFPHGPHGGVKVKEAQRWLDEYEGREVNNAAI